MSGDRGGLSFFGYVLGAVVVVGLLACVAGCLIGAVVAVTG